MDFTLSFCFLRFCKVKYLNFYEWVLKILWHSHWCHSDITVTSESGLFCAIFNTIAENDVFLCSVMLASHCPDFSSRWTHDEGNLQHRDWSWRHRVIRECILSHRVTAGWVFKGSGATSGVFIKSLACQKIAEGLPEGASSCGLRVSFSSTVWPSWVHRVDILWIRVAIVFTSCGHRRHRAFTLHDGNTMDTRCLPMVLRWLHDFARPSHSHRVATMWHFVTLKLYRNGITMSTKRVE